MQQVHTTPRGLNLDSAFNVRDVGGLVTSAGAAVRRRLVYRSGDLARLTAAGGEQLRTLGVATVVDLRTAAEVERRGRFPFEDYGIAYRHRPLVPESTTDSAARLADLPQDVLSQLNRHLAEEGGGNVAQVLTWLSESTTLPVVVHCVAGKDRTGMVIAVLLALLGVSDEAIAEDYALSEAGLAALRRWAEQHEPAVAEWLTRMPPQLLTAWPETILEFLGWLRERHGSVEGYARSIGLTDDTLIALRARLLTDRIA
jgi:protein tyrosine/serine phosphatase